MSPSVWIAAFAFINRSHDQQWRRHTRHTTTSYAFLSRELKLHPVRQCLHRPAALLLASFSPESDDNSISSDVKNSPSSSKRTKQGPSARINNGSGNKADNNAKANEAPTKTAKVTRIKSKTVQEKNINDDDHSLPSPPIQGLLPSKSFNLYSRIHCTLTLLRKHFPTLLELPPLSSSTAKQWVYDTNVTVTGPKPQELLADGLEEVLLLSRALATAATAARRAGRMFDMAVGTTGGSSSGQGRVECELLIDPNNSLKVMVLWRTRLPSIGIFNGNNKDDSTSQSYTEFSGKSTVNLSENTGLVTNLQINEVKVNGVPIVQPLGTALAAVRRAARTAMSTSSILQDNTDGDSESGSGGAKKRSSGNPFLDGLLNGIQDVVEAVDALPSLEESDDSSLESPMYVVPGRFWDLPSFPVEKGGVLVLNITAESVDGDIDSAEQHSTTYAPVPINQYSTSSGQIPLAGSEAFVDYAMRHKTIKSFARLGMFQLAGISHTDSEFSMDSSVSTIRSLFTTDAELSTFSSSSSADERDESITLLRGAGKVADLYRSLALIREASRGDWKVASLESDLETQRLTVSWKAESPLKIVGEDSFVFEDPSFTSLHRLPLSSDGDKEELAKRCISYFEDANDDNIVLKISRIENLQLTVAGVTADSKWSQSFVSAALRSGITENTPLPDATVTELLRALTTRKPTTKKATPKKESPTVDSSMPPLNNDATVSFYGIIRALHNDLPNIANANTSSSSTPACEFLTDTVELRGLLGEALVRGSQNYNRLLGVAVSSLRAAIKTNAVRLAAQPFSTIEVTSKGSIKVNFMLALWVSPTFSLAGAMGQSKDDANQGGFGVPLKIEILSEYRIDSTGRIREHQIIESRLNGVLTPGDVFSRWIKGLTGEEEESSKVVPSAIDSLMDVVTWVRSMQERK